MSPFISILAFSLYTLAFLLLPFPSLPAWPLSPRFFSCYFMLFHVVYGLFCKRSLLFHVIYGRFRCFLPCPLAPPAGRCCRAAPITAPAATAWTCSPGLTRTSVDHPVPAFSPIRPLRPICPFPASRLRIFRPGARSPWPKASSKGLTRSDSPGPVAERWHRLPACHPTLHLQ